jgi:hypothetical protein
LLISSAVRYLIRKLSYLVCADCKALPALTGPGGLMEPRVPAICLPGDIAIISRIFYFI